MGDAGAFTLGGLVARRIATPFPGAVSWAVGHTVTGPGVGTPEPAIHNSVDKLVENAVDKGA